MRLQVEAERLVGLLLAVALDFDGDGLRRLAGGEGPLDRLYETSVRSPKTSSSLVEALLPQISVFLTLTVPAAM
jgi:hypothetical protein